MNPHDLLTPEDVTNAPIDPTIHYQDTEGDIWRKTGPNHWEIMTWTEFPTDPLSPPIDTYLPLTPTTELT